MNPWDVPPIQKRIVETCKILGKPVVIATQMLERYKTEHPSPPHPPMPVCASVAFF